MMLNLTHPRYVMPVHGDYKRMLLHGRLAEAVGVPPENMFRTENGTPLEIDAEGARFGDRQTAGLVFVDGVDIGDVSDVALRDRRMLSADGIFIIVATVSEQDGSSVVAPEVLARGVPFLDDNAEIIVEIARRSRTRSTARRSSGSPRSTSWSRSCTTTSRPSSTTGSSAADGAAGRR